MNTKQMKKEKHQQRSRKPQQINGKYKEKAHGNFLAEKYNN